MHESFELVNEKTYMLYLNEGWNLIEFILCGSRERVPAPKEDDSSQENDPGKQTADGVEDSENAQGNYSSRSLLKSASISASKCIGGKGTRATEVTLYVICFKLYYFVFNVMTCKDNKKTIDTCDHLWLTLGLL